MCLFLIIIIAQIFYLLWSLHKMLELKLKIWWGGVHGVMVKMLDCSLKVSEFELQSHNVYFRTNTLEKGMNHQILPVIISTVSLQFYKHGFGIKYSTKVDMPSKIPYQNKELTSDKIWFYIL